MDATLLNWTYTCNKIRDVTLLAFNGEGLRVGWVRGGRVGAWGVQERSIALAQIEDVTLLNVYFAVNKMFCSFKFTSCHIRSATPNQADFI